MVGSERPLRQKAHRAWPTEGAATRLASACPGGLDAITGARSVWVACLQQAERGRGARATLFRFSERLERQGELVLAQAGSISSGISMTKTRDRMLVAWRDATLETEQIRQVTVKGDRLTGPAQVVSSRGIGVGAPYTSAQAGRSLTLWAERWPSDASLRGRIVVFDGRGAPRRVLDLHEPSETTPVLLAKHGTRLLAFRDRRGSRFRTGLYLTALSPDFVPIAGPRRVGRATGPSPARLCPCMGGLISATPRNFSTDLFVSVNGLPWDLGKPLGEQEFFEDDVQITRSAVACMQGHALLLMAERGTSTRRLVHLRAVPFECDWARK